MSANLKIERPENISQTIYSTMSRFRDSEKIVYCYDNAMVYIN